VAPPLSSAGCKIAAEDERGGRKRAEWLWRTLRRLGKAYSIRMPAIAKAVYLPDGKRIGSET